MNVFFANFTLGKVTQRAWLDPLAGWFWPVDHTFDTLALKRDEKCVLVSLTSTATLNPAEFLELLEKSGHDLGFFYLTVWICVINL